MSNSDKISGLRCQNCNRLMIQPVYGCLGCGSTKFTEEVLSGIGQIFSVVTADLPGYGFEEMAPYFLAAIRLKDDIMLIARLQVDKGKTPKIGDKVALVSANNRKYFFRLVD